MQTYIINLERSSDRRGYMQSLLQPFSCFNGYQFIPAVDGRTMSEDSINTHFLQDVAYKRYGRPVKRSEIGCVLSHYACYQKLVESGDNEAFIMEDDILFRKDNETLKNILPHAKQFLSIERPVILLFFGEYWWLYTKSFTEEFHLKRVYDAISAQGYMINRAAAQLLLMQKPSSLADDWEYIISRGIQVWALHPHIIDQEWMSFETTVSMDGYGSIMRRNLTFPRIIRTYWRGGIKRILKAVGHFDPHIIPEEEPEWAIRLGLCSPSSSPSSASKPS